MTPPSMTIDYALWVVSGTSASNTTPRSTKAASTPRPSLRFCAAQVVVQTAPQPLRLPSQPPLLRRPQRRSGSPSFRPLRPDRPPRPIRHRVRDVARRGIAVGGSNQIKRVVETRDQGPSVPAIGSEAAGGGDGAIREIVRIGVPWAPGGLERSWGRSGRACDARAGRRCPT
jgi:hypothetical protein